MNSSFQTFLTELYEIDPALREHEAELIPLIKKLLKSDPAQSPDADFVARLRMQLRERGAELSAPRQSVWQRLGYALGGAAVVAVILPIAFFASKPGMPTQQDGTSLFGYSVQNDKYAAFGSLATSGTPGQDGAAESIAPMAPGNNPAPTMMATPESAPTRNQSGGGGPTTGVGGGGMMDSKMMIYPYPMYDYDYVYEGEITDLQENVPVYLRTPGSAAFALSRIANSLNFGTIDLGSFSGMNVDSISLTQNVPYGYQLYLNLRDGSVNIDAQWDQWPQSKCATEECYQRNRIKSISEIPADDVLIAVAKKFAADHGVDLSNYGEPEVNSVWRQEYERVTDKSQAYLPDTIPVVFPVLLDGKPTYDLSGSKTGISMNVHVKEQKVMNVYGIQDRTYRKSDYAGVTNAAAIKAYIEKMGGGYGGYPMPLMRDGSTPPADQPEARKVTVVLGEPTVSFVLHYRYTSQKNDELFVPSLVFPVKEIRGGTGGFSPMNSVIVPLAKELFDQQQEGMGTPGVMPVEGDVRVM